MSVDKKRSPLGLIVGIGVAAITAGGAMAWWAIHSLQSTAPPQTTSQPTPQPIEQPSTPVLQETSVQVYWLNQIGELELLPSDVTVTVPESAPPVEVMEKAFESLLAGPSEQAYSTTIPEGTRLLNVEMKPDGVHVDLSQQFTSGGGSASMMGRLGQVIYTATSLEPSSSVWISVGGEPLEVLGGEGLIVDQPMTRQSFAENFAF
ncbi:MAG: GerMN domain-containing protein [Cyanophyceae cyanobacterium]